MCKSLSAYGSKTETGGPSAMLIIKELVHAATMHTDATVLRVGAGGCGAREPGTDFLSDAARLAVPRETGSVFSYRVVPDDNESGVENITGRFGSRLQLRVIIRVDFDPRRCSPFQVGRVGSYENSSGDSQHTHS